MKLIQNVLIIDPDRASRDLVKKLSRKGFNAKFTFYPDDGLDQVIEDKPDLVILSLDPKDESGLLVLTQISQASPGSMVIVSSEKVDILRRKKPAWKTQEKQKHSCILLMKYFLL